MECKYPRDLKMFFNGKTRSLNVEGHLYPASIADGYSPFTNYSGYSRFKFTYIDKTGQNPEYVYANVRPAEDVPDIIKRTEFADRRIYEFEMTKNTAAVSADGSRLTSPMYSVRFTNGYMKGKTPAEVLSEEGSAGRERLKKHYIFLRDNLAKYPNNKNQMDAIAEAINAYDNGNLQKVEGGASGAAIMILNQEMRPLVNKDMKYNKNFVYEIGVVCYPEKNYPYCVTIVNYYATVEKKDDGTYNVKKSTAQDVIEKSFNMSVKAWNELVYAMQAHMRQFENIIAAKQFGEANRADMDNRQGKNNIREYKAS